MCGGLLRDKGEVFCYLKVCVGVTRNRLVGTLRKEVRRLGRERMSQ